MPLNKNIKKVLVIGSGPIVIGQAAEFDYAGAQACRVLKDTGLEVVLVNSNPATIMTDKALADHIYLEPLTEETVKRIIEKEHPDSILGGLGGQTGLTISMQLAKDGYLDKMGVTLLGTTAQAIDKAEDRQLFRDTMMKLGQPVVPSDIATTPEHARQIAAEIGYPVIIRPAFTLGGAGGGVAYNQQQLDVIAKNGLMLSPITQVLVERYIAGWKEIEFEVMRDSAGNVIAVCSMENFDPVGVHTGDSIVIAPAVTLADKEYQMLRSASLDIITELGIEGGCNCQFALNPESMEYSVIEVNPRVSRSSALASKATGYPIAKVTTNIALGYTLDEIKNDVTGKTCACFEPTLDYVVVKVPKWPFDKFVNASRKLGTQMKATGEVMSIAPCFEAAIMKAVRGAEIGLDTLNNKALDGLDIHEKLHDQDDLRLFSVFAALKKGVSIEEIHQITMIDEWFLAKLKNLADYEKEITGLPLSREQYMQGKHYGYTDEALARISGGSIPYHQDCVYKMVDTCGAEFAAETPYFYSTYDAHCEARSLPQSGKQKIIVLGSGPIRIGQGIEFDYSSVHCVWTLKELGYEVILINNNPETVSTDFDTGDRLYFEPLCPEDVMQVIQVEKPIGVVVAFGGQTAIKLTKFLDEKGITILGTSAESIDIAEDRERFDALLEKFGIFRPKGTSVMTMPQALVAANELGYPVLVRPSYVLGGQGMQIAVSDEDVVEFMNIINRIKQDHPILVDKYLMGKEIEVDAVCDGENILIPGIMEHIERAGIHSGDSISVYPAKSLTPRITDMIVDYTAKLARSLHVKGLINIQFIVYNDQVYVIEVNPRSSRTVPYISKVTGIPIVKLATKVITGSKITDMGYEPGLQKKSDYYAIKMPVFSFEKIRGADISLGPEMKSTGECLGISKDFDEALYKAFQGAGICLPKHKQIIMTLCDADKEDGVDIAQRFEALGYKIYASRGTAKVLKEHGVHAIQVNKIGQEAPTLLDLILEHKIDLVIDTPENGIERARDGFLIRRYAIETGVHCLTSLDTAHALISSLEHAFNNRDLSIVDIAEI